jgi:hypothetical protein
MVAQKLLYNYGGLLSLEILRILKYDKKAFCIAVIKSRRERWAGHVVRMGEMRNA